MEVNKIRSMARHSGDQILRYVAEAPLRSLRADLGLTPARGTSAAARPFGPTAASSSTARTRARLRKPEAAIARLEAELQEQARDVVGLATGFARTDDRVFVQNTTTAALHYAVANNAGGTVCGWPFAAARKKGGGPAYRIVPSLCSMPGFLMCERCLPTERAIAMRNPSDTHELSGDE